MAAALAALDSAQPFIDAGGGVFIGFVILPILGLAGIPWSLMIINDNDLPVALRFVLMGAGVLMNALLMGFAIGVARSVRIKKR